MDRVGVVNSSINTVSLSSNHLAITSTASLGISDFFYDSQTILTTLRVDGLPEKSMNK